MYNTNKTINGTFGEVWVDDYYMAEVTGLQAKVTLKKDSVNQTGTLAEGYNEEYIKYIYVLLKMFLEK